MRRLFSLVCLVLILLNVMGYYCVLLGLQSHNTKRLVSSFDKGTYDQKKAIHFKVAYKTSQPQSEEFERVDGEFQTNGQLYRLIKQRIYMDTFHIVYIKDIRGTAINLALKDYVDSFANQPSGDDDGDAYVIPLFMKEYWVRSFSLLQGSSGWSAPVVHITEDSSLTPAYFPDVVHPPNV